MATTAGRQVAAQVVVQIYPQDVETCAAFVRRRVRLRSLLFSSLLLAITFGLAGLAVFRAGGSRIISSYYPALLAFAVGFSVLAIWGTRALARERVSATSAPLTLTLSASGITGVGVTAFANPWAQVRGFADTGEHIVILLNGVTGHVVLVGAARGYVVPKRCFGDEAQRTAFLAELNQYSRPLTAALDAREWRMIGYLLLMGLLVLALWATWPHRGQCRVSEVR